MPETFVIFSQDDSDIFLPYRFSIYIFFCILDTCLTNGVFKLLGEILFWSDLESRDFFYRSSKPLGSREHFNFFTLSYIA